MIANTNKQTNKKTATWAVEFGFYIDNWIYSGDDLLFRGLSQSTIGDTGFPCLVRDGTEGGSRSIITRINPANIIILLRIILNVLFKHTVKTYKSQDDKIKSQWFD